MSLSWRVAPGFCPGLFVFLLTPRWIPGTGVAGLPRPAIAAFGAPRPLPVPTGAPRPAVSKALPLPLPAESGSLGTPFPPDEGLLSVARLGETGDSASALLRDLVAGVDTGHSLIGNQFDKYLLIQEQNQTSEFHPLASWTILLDCVSMNTKATYLFQILMSWRLANASYVCCYSATSYLPGIPNEKRRGKTILWLPFPSLLPSFYFSYYYFLFWVLSRPSRLVRAFRLLRP